MPEDWRGRVVTLSVGGARIDTYCFVNGIYIGLHHGHDTPFEFEVTDQLKYGQSNEFILAVDNRVDYINSCALRGYAGQSGGIYGDVALHVSDGPGKIVSYYVHPENRLERMRWKAELTAPDGLPDGSRLVWSISTVAGKHITAAKSPSTRWSRARCSQWIGPVRQAASSLGIPWEPNLHRIELRWENRDGRAIDSGSRTFGLRQLESRDGRLYLNGRPIMLRGICEITTSRPLSTPPITWNTSANGSGD